MEARFGMHWWRFSTPVEDVEEVLASIEGVSGGGFSFEQRGGYNQPQRFLHDSGAAVYFGSPREDQPIVVDAPGEACEQVSDEALVTWAENLEGLPSRVDLAVDCGLAEQAEQRLLEMKREFEAGRCQTRIPATSTDFLVSKRPGGGSTLYVGSNSSEAFLRGYTKRGPLRLEWQWKPNKRLRVAVPGTIARYGVAGVWRRLGTRCIWPMQWYRDLLEGQCADIAAAPTRPDDLSRTMQAIAEQLGPSLWALQMAGVVLGDLAKRPDQPNAQQLRKWSAWVQQAPDLGYDASDLEREVKQWQRKSR